MRHKKIAEEWIKFQKNEYNPQYWINIINDIQDMNARTQREDGSSMWNPVSGSPGMVYQTFRDEHGISRLTMLTAPQMEKFLFDVMKVQGEIFDYATKHPNFTDEVLRQFISSEVSKNYIEYNGKTPIKKNEQAQDVTVEPQVTPAKESEKQPEPKQESMSDFDYFYEDYSKSYKENILARDDKEELFAGIQPKQRIEFKRYFFDQIMEWQKQSKDNYAHDVFDSYSKMESQFKRAKKSFMEKNQHQEATVEKPAPLAQQGTSNFDRWDKIWNNGQGSMEELYNAISPIIKNMQAYGKQGGTAKNSDGQEVGVSDIMPQIMAGLEKKYPGITEYARQMSPQQVQNVIDENTRERT